MEDCVAEDYQQHHIRERKRLRELEPFFYALAVQSHADSITTTAYDPGVAVLSKDSVLTSLAQLGALRLQCDRSFISLIDGDSQHIIAEATKSVSLYKSNEHIHEDGLAFGARRIDLMAGVCASTIRAFTSHDPRDHIDTPNVTANSSLYVIRDFRKEPYFENRPYVTGWPHMRFYAEVPITSRAGYVLGSVCVVDNKVRNEFSKNDHTVLSEIASTIQDYLYSLREKKAYSRSVQLIKGLNTFLSPESDPLPSESGASVPVEEASLTEQIGTELETVYTPECVDVAQEYFDSTLSPSMKDSLDEASRNSSQHPSVHRSQTSMTTLSNCTSHKEPTCSNSSNREPSTRLDTDHHHAVQVELGNLSRNKAVSKESQKIFERACSLLRKAMDLDGMVFLSTRLSQRPRNSSLSKFDAFKPLSESLKTQNGSDTYKPELNKSLNTPPSHNPKTSIIQELDTPTLCGQLGCSTNLGSAMTSSEPISNLSLPEDILQRMLDWFPQGHIFNFDVEGLVISPNTSHGDGDTRENSKYSSYPADPNGAHGHKNSREYGPSFLSNLELETLRTCFPGVRHLIFFPLRDQQKERWIAAGIAWSTDPYKTFERPDITYLTAFGNSITSELSRHEVNAINNTKSDFISSISHEMRSPIHGILANVELLRSRDTEQKTDEDEYVEMIDHCGRSLLDTVENLLDFATINSISKTPEKGQSIQRPKLIPNNAKLPTIFDLAKLVEQVTEETCRKRQYLVKPDFRSEKSDSSGVRSNPLLPGTLSCLQGSRESRLHENDRSPVTIALNIDKSTERFGWFIKSRANVWRRMLDSVLSNALKYTSNGLINVSLGLISSKTTRTSQAEDSIILEITDTGIGISQNYLDYDVFSPFTQENDLSVGTGLGLSIVKQLISYLDGTVKIESEVGFGTKVTLAIPLSSVLAETISPEAEMDLVTDGLSYQEAKQVAPNLKVCLITEELLPDISETPTGILSGSAQATIALRSAIALYISEWMNIEVHYASSVINNTADVFIIPADYLNSIQTNSSTIQDPVKGLESSHVIVLCNTISCHHTSETLPYYCQHIASPFGPQRLRAALKHIISYQRPLGGPRNEEVPQQNLVGEPAQVPLFDCEEFQREQHLKHSKSVSLDLPLRKMNNASPPTDTPHHVLLVEDNAINMKILVVLMKKMKFSFETAIHGLDALEKYRHSTKPFDTVLMDISMPVMDGFTATREIRAFELTNNKHMVKIIALTALGSAKAQQEAFESGCDLFLTKPVSLKGLKKVFEIETAEQ